MTDQSVNAASRIRQAQLALLVTAALIVLMTVLTLLWVSEENFERERSVLIDRDMAQADVWLDALLTDQTALLGTTLLAVEGRPDLVAALEQRDRQTLQQVAAPLYQHISDEHRITHLYFHDPEGRVFLRSHEPANFGDLPARATLAAAMRTGQPSTAIEQGKNGLTLRYVKPWLHEGNLIGFLEAGMEVGHTLRELERVIGVLAVVAIARDAVDVDRVRSSGIAQSTAYALDEDYLLISYGNLSLDPNTRDLIASGLAQSVGDIVQLPRDAQGRFFAIERLELPLSAAAKGEVLFIKDVSDARVRATDARNRYMLLVVIVGLVGATLFWLALNRARRRMQQLAVEMETRLQATRLAAKIGDWRLAGDPARLVLSREAASVLGTARNDDPWSVRGFLSAVDAEDRPRLLRHCLSALRRATPLDLVVGFTRADGERIALRLQSHAADGHESASGEPSTTLAGTVQDVTDLKAAELRARKSEYRQRAIIESTTDGILLIDEFADIDEANQAAEAMFGYAPGALNGKSLNAILVDDSELEIVAPAAWLEGWVGNPGEVQGIKASGEHFPLRLGVGRVVVEGRPYFVCLTTDLTEVNRLELQLRHMQKMESIGELSGGIAHDFNNILGIVIGQLDMMERVTDDEKLLKRIRSAQRAVMRGADLSRRLLSFSRSTGAKAMAINVSHVLLGTQELVEKSLTRNIDVDWKLDSQDWLVAIDPNGLEDVLINLSLNARDAMPDGGRLTIATRNVTLSEEDAQRHAGLQPGDWVELSVSDDGIGIPAEAIERIYDPFFSTKQQQKGTGLGLSMVYGFVKRSGGTIVVYSQPAVGTTFRIYLPRAADLEASAAGALAPQDPRELPTGDESILVVDDEEDLAEAAGSILQRLGYGVTIVHSGDAALKLLAEGATFDLVFSDVVMPGEISGLLLAREIRANYPALPVLLSSGYAGRIAQKPEDALWLERLVPKPYRDYELATAVREALDEAALAASQQP